MVSIGDLCAMPNLKKLHLRSTEIEKIELFPKLPKLEYLNLRESKLASIEDIKKVEVLGNLTTLSFQGSPVADDLGAGLKKELILLFPDLYLEKINKEPVTQEDHQEAEELKQERILEEEEKRRAAEAAEAEGEGKPNE